MKSITPLKEPLATFYHRVAKEYNLIPVDYNQAKKFFRELKNIPPEVIRARIQIICKYYNDITDAFPRYKSKYIVPQIILDKEILSFLKEKMKRRSQDYQIKYNPDLFMWALTVAKEKNFTKVEEKLKEGISYEEIKGTILKAYEALEMEADYFLRQLINYTS